MIGIVNIEMLQFFFFFLIPKLKCFSDGFDRTLQVLDYKCILIIGFWTFYRCLYLQCHSTLKLKNDGLGPVVEGLCYCYVVGKNSGGRGAKRKSG